MRALLLLPFFSLLLSCSQEAPSGSPRVYRPRIDNPANARSIDSALHLLRSGDVALRAGFDMTSIMLRGMNQRDDRYSHCGIVMVEDGYPFVYHSIGGEDNPDARLRRDSAGTFFSPFASERLGIARLKLSAAQQEDLHTIVRRHFKAGVPFDMDFDLRSDDRFYCAEFVCKSLQEALGNPALFAHSRALNIEYIGVDNITDTAHARIVCDVRYKL